VQIIGQYFPRGEKHSCWVEVLMHNRLPPIRIERTVRTVFPLEPESERRGVLTDSRNTEPYADISMKENPKGRFDAAITVAFVCSGRFRVAGVETDCEIYVDGSIWAHHSPRAQRDATLLLMRTCGRCAATWRRSFLRLRARPSPRIHFCSLVTRP
jgi:hypothetical protein